MIELSAIGFSREKKKWTPLEDHILECLYKELSYRQVGSLIGRAEGSVRNRCYEKGWRKQVEDWTPLEVQELITWYAEHNTGRGDLQLPLLATRLGRQESNVCRKARELGLTDNTRPFGDTLLAAFRESCKGVWDRWEHPRGMKGKSHTAASKKKMSDKQKEVQGSFSEEKVAQRVQKARDTRALNPAPSAPTANTYSRCKRGRREDLGNFFFRSSWEANYARYLNLLVAQKVIASWEYEVDTFVFHGETRGAISYLPDFKVWSHEGTHEYHEVKGWMDGKSKTKLKRMQKHYPNEKVVVIGQKEYRELERRIASHLPNWEDSK
jgi:hypothetical protein